MFLVGGTTVSGSGVWGRGPKLLNPTLSVSRWAVASRLLE